MRWHLRCLRREGESEQEKKMAQIEGGLDVHTAAVAASNVFHSPFSCLSHLAYARIVMRKDEERGSEEVWWRVDGWRGCRS